LYNRLIHLVRGAKRKERDDRLFMFESDLGHDCDITGQTMLHQFVNELDRVEFDRLLKIVEDINYPNARIKTFTTPGRNRQQPLHRAAVTGNNQAARYLLQNGAEFNAVDNVGRTALCLAAWHGRLLVCETLVARVGMEINKPDRYGQTALHMAALNGKQAVVDLLLRQTGIEPDNRYTIVIGGVVHECKTPQQLAEEAGHDGVAESIQVCVKKLGERAGSHMKPFPVDPNASKFGQRW
jgi:ankyrin repeat protein